MPSCCGISFIDDMVSLKLKNLSTEYAQILPNTAARWWSSDDSSDKSGINDYSESKKIY